MAKPQWRKDREQWTPFTGEFKVVKLSRSGPKEGQSLNGYLWGKELEARRFARDATMKPMISNEEIAREDRG